MTWLERLSLLSGPLPVILGVMGFAALARSLAGGGSRWYRQAALLALASVGAVVAAGTAIGIEHKVGSTFPQSFFVWAALPIFAVSVAAVRWRSRRWSGRVTALAAVLLLFGFGAANLNAHYAYLPTVGDLLGHPMADQVPVAYIARPGPAAPEFERHGAVVAVEIPGTVSGFHSRRALVWLPPAYFEPVRPSLPAVLMVAGVPGDPSNLIRAGHAERVADDYATAHAGWAPIMVFPDHNGGFLNDTECVNGPRGAAETYLLTDVPRYLEERFGASGAGTSWGILGYSEGGTCAVTLALRHPDRFGAFVDIAGDLRPTAASGRGAVRATIRRLYGGDARQWAPHDPLTLLHRGLRRKPRAAFVAGTDDASALANGRALASAACRAGLDTTLHLIDGGHSFATVHRALVDALPGLFDALAPNAAAPSVTCRLY